MNMIEQKGPLKTVYDKSMNSAKMATSKVMNSGFHCIFIV